jgi:hypothetical protein
VADACSRPRITSDYWRIFYYLAEAAGLEVWLVNARDVKHLPGRGKSDKADCVWPGSGGSCEVAVPEMGEGEGGAGDVADFAKPCGDGWRVRQRPVSKANPCSPEAAQGTLDGVAGTAVDIEVPLGGCLTGARMPPQPSWPGSARADRPVAAAW